MQNPCDCDKSKQRRAAEKEGEQAAEESVGNGHLVEEAPSADGQESDPSLKHISAGDWELAKEVSIPNPKLYTPPASHAAVQCNPLA